MGLSDASSSMISSQRTASGKGSSLFFHTSDANGVNQTRMWLNDAGNVGIGTLSPASRLHIVQNDNLIGLTLESSSLGWGSGMSFKNTAPAGKAYGIYSSSWGTLEFVDQAAGVDRMIITPNGSVGIGTSATSDAAFKLFVEGGIKTRKVKVDQATWADYVFQSGYRLPLLDEVESYIKANHHLPEVPSADEIQNNGLDLGDNQAVLLKKIEELTLYIIEQNKRLEQKDKEIADIKSKLSEIDELKAILKELKIKGD